MSLPPATPALHIAVVGLEFGSAFVPLFRDHPGVASVTVCDLDIDLARRARDHFGVERAVGDLTEVLEDDAIDAVHIVTGIADHAAHSIAALDAGKHVASAVPMGLRFEELDRIVDARVRSGRHYMMMETAAFTREYHYVAGLLREGAMGEIIYARGTHFQDMTGWPAYWRGLPPMHYATHAIAPILRLLDARATRVRALGAGTLTFENQGGYRNRFPLETALVELADHPAVVEIARSLFQIARASTESFSIYGDRMSFEWPQSPEDDPLVHEMGEVGAARGRPVTSHRIDIADADHLLPVGLRGAAPDAHGGSHPHLVHEFVSSILDDRPSTVDDTRAANWTATGIAAHLSAMRGGDAVTIPSFARA